MTKILDGKKISDTVLSEIEVALNLNRTRPPGLAFILVGKDPASESYVRMKKKRCGEIGIASFDKEFPETISETSLLEEIEALNHNPLVDGILVQLPLPSHICSSKITSAISPEKDVDGFHPYNMGCLLLGERTGFYPCTPYGIITLLNRYHIEVTGKHVVVIGRSNIVGKPLAALLMQKLPGCNATVTVAHSATENLAAITKTADILVAAIGVPHFVKKDMVKEGAVVIDVGINRIQEGGSYKIVGDVDYDSVFSKCAAITPVPGGIGPMTIAMLMHNTFQSFQKRCT